MPPSPPSTLSHLFGLPAPAHRPGGGRCFADTLSSRFTFQFLLLLAELTPETSANSSSAFPEAASLWTSSSGLLAKAVCVTVLSWILMDSDDPVGHVFWLPARWGIFWKAERKWWGALRVWLVRFCVFGFGRLTLGL